MPTALRPTAFVVLALVGCNADWPDLTCATDECTTSGSSGDGPGGPPTTGEPATTDAASTGTASVAGDSETEAPVGDPPSIVQVDLDPNPVELHGFILVTVHAQDATRVTMRLADSSERDLTPAGGGTFTGAIQAFTGLDNGKYVAEFTPFAGDDPGDVVLAPYEIDLLEAGEQALFEVDGLGGPGQVVALGEVRDHEIAELGTFFENGEPRCYLRRRDRFGGTPASEGPERVDLFPGEHCTATDLAADPVDGTMHVLVTRKGEQGDRWLLAQVADWGEDLEEIALGAAGEQAHALTLAEDGRLAACGSKLVDGERSAASWQQHGQGITLHTYDTTTQQGKSLDEIARDCAFSGDTLVLVGEALGLHEGEFDLKRRRLFVLEHDLVADTSHWMVAAPAPELQSDALAVAVDPDGNYWLAARTCGDICEPDAELRVYAPGGGLLWRKTLAHLGDTIAGPHTIAWSPAGFVVVAFAAPVGPSFRFKVQAFSLGVTEARWTFETLHPQGLEIPFASTVAKFGDVYVGGIAEGGFPAFAYVGG